MEPKQEAPTQEGHLEENYKRTQQVLSNPLSGKTEGDTRRFETVTCSRISEKVSQKDAVAAVLIQYTFKNVNVRSLCTHHSNEPDEPARFCCLQSACPRAPPRLEKGGCDGRPTGQTAYRHRPLIIAAIADSKNKKVFQNRCQDLLQGTLAKSIALTAGMSCSMLS